MRHVRHEATVLELGRLEPPDRVRQHARHPVEPLGPGAELVARGHGHARGQVAALDPLRDPTGFLHRGEHATHDDADRGQCEDQQERCPEDQGKAKLVDGLLQAADVVDEVERRTARCLPAPDHERWDPGHVRPGVRELAAGDRIAHLAREPVQQALEVAVGQEWQLIPAQVDHGLDPTLLEGLSQGAALDVVVCGPVGQLAAGHDDRQVETGLVGGGIQRLGMQPHVDEQRRTDAQHDRHEDDQSHDRGRQPCPDPAQRRHRLLALTGWPCNRRPGP